MCDNTYEFTLKEFKREGMRGHISVNVTPERVTVGDYSIGSSVEGFFGSDEHEYDVTVGIDAARAVLKAYSIVPGPYPTMKLALRFAERYADDGAATTKFRELIEAAGVEPKIWMR